MKLIALIMIKYGIFGSNGKMGQALKLASESFKNAELKQLFDRSFKKEQAEGLDFIIDFSSPQGTLFLAREMQGSNILIICGTTGFNKAEFQELKELSKGVKILYSANFSLGIRAIARILRELSKELENYDVEILEKHHNLKKDAPSGTALLLGRAVAMGREQDFENVKIFNRNSERKKDEIGFACIRQGSIFGFHEVSFANNDERIWIGHEAFNKTIFAKGAITAGVKGVEKFKSLYHGFFELEDLEE
jgi:4-hydroxy-tetrahydrodipicolinate reductase